MNYVGSKKSLIDFIYKNINEVTGNNKNMVILDAFAGTGAVGSFFKKQGYKVLANDSSLACYLLNKHYIANSDIIPVKPELLKHLGLSKKENIEDSDLILEHLNSLEGEEGFIYNNYSPGGTSNLSKPRMYFTDDNAKRIDAVKLALDDWSDRELLGEHDMSYLYACLLDSADKVANTACTYEAYLKKFKNVALKPFKLKAVEKIKNTESVGDSYLGDINCFIGSLKHDILYLDPPYNGRQYSSMYFILDILAHKSYCQNDLDNNFPIYGVVGKPKTRKSLYSSKKGVKNALNHLISIAESKYIFLSYSSEGILSPEDIKGIMSKKGKYGVFSQEHRRFTTKKDDGVEPTIEYLHYIECYEDNLDEKRRRERRISLDEEYFGIPDARDIYELLREERGKNE